MAQQALAGAKTLLFYGLDFISTITPYSLNSSADSGYGIFPQDGDPFHFLPCTQKSLPPSLDDPHPEISWAKLYQPDPTQWSWGQLNASIESTIEDPFDGRGIYMCGYLDVPIDYTNQSDGRIVRLAVTKFQVSGLARQDGRSKLSTGQKSARTLVINPGGPSASGTAMAWNKAESLTHTFSNGEIDVLGWDPRGVNISLPNVSCYPKDGVRDRWSLFSGTIPFASLRTGMPRKVLGDTMAHLRFADALNDATFSACKRRVGDFPRFTSTAFIARDVEQIRAALGEGELTAYLVSYGTSIGGTYVNMFPERAGRVILDAVAPLRESRDLGGFLYWPDDVSVKTWREGFLGECTSAGPERCALSAPTNGKPVTLANLERRMDKLFESVAERPMPAYTDASGPFVITYGQLVLATEASLLEPQAWGLLARMLASLEQGDSSIAAAVIDGFMWHANNPYLRSRPGQAPYHSDVRSFVVCSDSYDAPLPDDGLYWWDRRWANMTGFSWLTGDLLFYDMLACQQFKKYWPDVAEVYRGDLGKKLKTPVLLMAVTHDPGVPLESGKARLREMGSNARLIVHHGYGHSALADPSRCSNAAAKAYILYGTAPEQSETDCYADRKPFLYE